MAENNFNNKELDEMLKKVASRLNKNPNELKRDLQSGKTENYGVNLSENNKKKLQELLNDEEKLKKLLSGEKAKALLEKLMKGNNNG